MKESERIVNNGNEPSGFAKLGQKLARVKIPTPTSLHFGHALGGAAGIVLTATIMGWLASSPPVVANGDGQKFAGPLPSSPPVVANGDGQNFDGPTFANPCEIHYRENEKRLRGVIEIVSGMFLIPNVGSQPMRQFRGSDPAKPCPTPTPGATKVPTVSPGPTLRARLGDQMQISFFNKAIDRTQDPSRTFFPYTLDTTSKGGNSSFGCDQSGTSDASGIIFPYPGNDKFPNCFHGSATANIHFHGTHTSPDGLADNVLVQVLADMGQQDWSRTFDPMFDSRKIPQTWLEMPKDYRNIQMALISKHDDTEKQLAEKNGLLAPEPLSVANQHRIDAGDWPQYLMGAFPNFFDIPDYDLCKALPMPCKAGQAPGTHWYHAHKHGSTSLHMLNGLAGAFIIESNKEGGYDHFIRKSLGWTSYEAHEKIFVFQQFDSNQILKRDNLSRVLVNGILTPTIYMRPGEIQLWRLVNATEGTPIVAGSSTTSLFQTEGRGFTFRQTAQDGVQFSKDNYANQPFLNRNSPGGQVPGGMRLAPANRVDMLVQAPTTLGRTAFKNGNDVLFFVRVTGEPMPPNTPPIPSDWTADPLPFLQDLLAPPPKDNPNFVQFQWEAGRKAPGPNDAKFHPHFMINGKQFAEYGEVVDQCMPQDGLQDWVLENYTTEIAHPFHIHINPFQVIQIDVPDINPDDPTKHPTYAPTKNFIWQDVIAIPPAVISEDGRTITPGRVRIRHQFVDFTGTYVLHCHILQHEDRGMMQLVRVVPANNYPNGCQMSIPAHH